MQKPKIDDRGAWNRILSQAADALPPGYEIAIRICDGEATVTLSDPYGEEVYVEHERNQAPLEAEVGAAISDDTRGGIEVGEP